MHPYLIEQLASEHRNDLLQDATLRHMVSEGRPKAGPRVRWWCLRRRFQVLVLPGGELPTVESS